MGRAILKPQVVFFKMDIWYGVLFLDPKPKNPSDIQFFGNLRIFDLSVLVS